MEIVRIGDLIIEIDYRERFPDIVAGFRIYDNHTQQQLSVGFSDDDTLDGALWAAMRWLTEQTLLVERDVYHAAEQGPQPHERLRLPCGQSARA